MTKPALMDVVRRAYELWEQAGKPEGRDQEFYFEAERQLQEALAKSAREQ
jgi:ribonuclease I